MAPRYAPSLRSRLVPLLLLLQLGYIAVFAFYTELKFKGREGFDLNKDLSDIYPGE